MNVDLPVLAGTISTIIFFVGTFPMLAKAWRTKDLRSYSKGILVLNNTRNVIHAVYIYSLPPGPIWALHGFYLIATALMLGWYVLYEERPARRGVEYALHGSAEGVWSPVAPDLVSEDPADKLRGYGVAP